MKTTFFKLITLTLFTFSFFTIKAQVNGVNYLMKYNTDSCWYDCYFVVNNGTASGIERVAFFSQFSIVSLAGDSLEIAQSYQPIETDGDTAQWNFSSIVKHPDAQPANNFWSVIPNMTLSFYPELSPGDTIKLFSVRKVGTTTLCGADLRIYINGTDPSSSAAGMQGSDFSNTFTIGSASNEVYEGNGAQILGPKPKINNFDFNCSNGIEIDLTATTTECQTPLSYHWTGSAGFTSNTEDVNISPSTAANNGKYWVTITDAMGCIAIDSTQAVDKPSAGLDVTDCAGTNHTIIGNPLGGTWSKISGNANVTTSNISPGVNQVIFNNLASGSYQFKYSMGSSGTCTDTMRFLINPIPSLTINDDNACVGETISNNLVGFGSGTWISNNPAIATVTTVNGNTASVTAVAAGTATFTFIRNNTNCQNTTPVFTVNANPTIVGINPLCVGSSMTLSSNNTGTWTMPPTDIVIVDPTTGVVTAIAAGTTPITYTETATGCSDTENITVITKPTVNIIGNDSICIAGTTKLSANTTGTWVSNSPLIATVNNAGVVTGLAVGAATFTFTALSGCVSDPSSSVTVTSKPVIQFAGDTLCIGGTTTLYALPLGLGTWVSNNVSVATINSGGVVTAVGEGRTTFVFTSNNGHCASDVSHPLTVQSSTPISITPFTSCVGTVAVLNLPGSGIWVSSDVAVAKVVGNTIIAVAPGVATLTYYDDEGCLSQSTTQITVLAKPEINASSNGLCIGYTSQLYANMVGTWQSLNNDIATINNSGLVTGVSHGSAKFLFTALAGCASDPITLTIHPKPNLSWNKDTIQILKTVFFKSDISVGSWKSSNSKVASINSNGVLIGKGVGKTKVSFVSEETCVSDSVSIVVNANPLIWKDLPVVFTPKNNTSQDSIVNDIALDQREDKSINTSGSVSYYIYPNPGTGLFHISGFKGSESAVVLNAQGQLIEQCKGPLCDLTNLPSGVYLVRIMNDTKWEMHKILKQ